MADAAPDRSQQADPSVSRQRERVELVALALCQIDGREPEGVAWGGAVMEAFRHVTAFDALQRYDRVAAAFVAAPATEQ